MKIESLVSDVLVLAYNAVWSLCLLAYRPLRAARRLHVRFQNKRRVQIAPHSLLFVSIFATSAGYAASVDRLPEVTKSILFGGQAPPEVLHSAIVAAALLALADALIRCVAWLVHRRDRRRQDRFIKLALYTASAQMIYLNLVIAVFLLWVYLAFRNVHY